MRKEYVRFRIDMYDDTKFKIIEKMEERDVIHYIWGRLIMLAAKCYREGELFLSNTIPYTIETLAIEVNRDEEIVELALKVFIKLEMIELSCDNVYVVKNFLKHQNIKTKKTIRNNNYKNEVENEVVKSEVTTHTKKELNSELEQYRDEKVITQVESITVHNELEKHKEESLKENYKETIESKDADILENINDNTNKVDNIYDSKGKDNKEEISMFLTQKPKKSSKKKSRSRNKLKDKQNDIISEEVEEPLIIFSDDGEDRPLGKGEKVVWTM